MSPATRVLVTGIGGDLGQAIATALRRHGVEIVGADCDTLHTWTVGPFADGWFHALPRADDPLYVRALEALVAARAVDAVALGTEVELARTRPGRLPVPILRCTPAPLAHMLADKAVCAAAFGERRLPFASTVPGGRVIGKPARSSGGRGLQEFTAEVFQEYLAGPEYTVAVWQDRAFALRRELRGGATVRAWYEPENPNTAKAEALGRRIGAAFGLHGSFNVQLRVCPNDEAVPFELNPRFSGTTAMRDAMGFCDAWWSLQAALGLPVDGEAPTTRQPARALRYWAEAVQVGGEWRTGETVGEAIWDGPQ